MKIAYQGARGSFSELMVRTWHRDAEAIPCRTFDEAFTLVEAREADMAVIPLENSLTGRIGPATDRLMCSPLLIRREGALKIEHCLIGNPAGSASGIRRIYGHPEALSQCRTFLEQCSAEIISWWDGAGAAQKVVEDPAAALVGNEQVASNNGLIILRRGIQDIAGNYTRFVGLCHSDAPPSGNDKTTVSFTLQHEPGSLAAALVAFERHGINLTRLSSMPVRDSPWTYAFIADFRGHRTDEHVMAAMETLKGICKELHVHGSYRIEVGG
jgi:prephenate dehydratase